SRVTLSNARCTSTRTGWCRRCFPGRSFRPEPPLESQGMRMVHPTLYGQAGNSYVWSARLALAEEGVTHELVDVPFGAHGEEPHLPRQPFAKVPASSMTALRSSRRKRSCAMLTSVRSPGSPPKSFQLLDDRRKGGHAPFRRKAGPRQPRIWTGGRTGQSLKALSPLRDRGSNPSPPPLSR